MKANQGARRPGCRTSPASTGSSSGSTTGTSPGDASSTVRAGGGVVWRSLPTGTEVVLVHRPAYDDWTLPKGKARSGESDLDAALREVREETGLSCRAGQELPSTSYPDREGRAKTVRYWMMTALHEPGGPLGRLRPAPEATREIDDLAWVPLDKARPRLTYPRDVVVLDAFEQLSGLSQVRRQEVHDVLEGEPERYEAD